jgi:hypothetical protein
MSTSVTARPASPRAAPTSISLARELYRTTPRLLWTAAGLICLGALFFLIAASNGISQVRHATQTIGRDAVPSIVDAQKIAATLADMDANAANYLIATGDENAQADQAFEKDRTDVTNALVSAAQNITYGDEERIPITTINANLDLYLEDVGAARVMHQAGRDADALAKYRAATALMTGTILPAANQLDAANLKYLNQAYAAQRQSSAGASFLVLFAGLVLLVLLIATQVVLSQRTRRVFNLPLVVATAVTLVATLVIYSNLRAGDEDLRAAKQDSFDSIHALWQARAVANDANADESRYLLDQANAATFQTAFFAKANQIAKIPAGQSYDGLAALAAQDATKLPPDFTGFLAAELRNVTYPGEMDAATTTLRDYGRYIQIDGQIRALEQAGQHQAAVTLCDGYAPGQSNWAYTQYDNALGTTLDINQKYFDQQIAQSFATVNGFDVVIPIVALVIAALSFAGLYPRIGEYR